MNWDGMSGFRIAIGAILRPTYSKTSILYDKMPDSDAAGTAVCERTEAILRKCWAVKFSPEEIAFALSA
jgi:hypothetical protein